MSELVYKYCDENGIKILVNLKLILTPPDKFNDPFEVSPSFDEAEIKKEIDAKFIIDEVVQFWRKSLIEEGYSSDKVSTMESLKNAVFEFQKNDYRNSCSMFQTAISKRHGVVCLSTKYNDILMWSHYTNHHKGMVIGFDIDKLAPDSKTRITVSYDCEKIRVPIFIDPEDFKRQLENPDSAYFRIYQRKYIQWEYESEIRLIASLDKKDIDGEYYIDIKPEMIKMIYLGCRSDSYLEKIVKIIREKEEFTHISLFKMDRSYSHFRLIEVKV